MVISITNRVSAYLADFILLVFDPKPILFNNYGIESIYIVDYFDYWKKFRSNNKNKLSVGKIVAFFLLR